MPIANRYKYTIKLARPIFLVQADIEFLIQPVVGAGDVREAVIIPTAHALVKDDTSIRSPDGIQRLQGYVLLRVGINLPAFLQFEKDSSLERLGRIEDVPDTTHQPGFDALVRPPGPRIP
jgi:hypothetical protein